MVGNSLTTACCKKIVANVLAMEPWTVESIAKAIDNAPEYVLRIKSGRQSFQESELESLAKACGKYAHELIFETIDPSKVPARMRGLYDLTAKEVQRHRDFEAVMTRKPQKKSQARPNTRPTAPSAKSSTKPAAKRAFART